MISTKVYHKKKGEKFERVFRKFFEFQGYSIPTEKIAAYIATVLISRVRKSFMKQENPDGSKWSQSAAAKKRLGGGYTWTKGGPYAGGKRKVTGGNTLFASGNLYHSIQLVAIGPSAFSIRTDVPYAKYYMNEDRTIIGTTGTEITNMAQLIISRML